MIYTFINPKKGTTLEAVEIKGKLRTQSEAVEAALESGVCSAMGQAVIRARRKQLTGSKMEVTKS